MDLNLLWLLIRELYAQQDYKVGFFQHFVCFCFCFSLVAKNLQVYVSSITNNISFHYFLKLGSDSLYYTFNQGRRQNF